MLQHEFILVTEVPDNISFSDYPRNEMTIISDDFILENHVSIRRVKMYWHEFGN